MEELMKELFETYHRDIYAYLYSLCRDVSLSEDLTSEVFVEVIKSINSFRGESDIKTWLFTIARRRWAAHLRKQHRQIKTEILSDFLESGDSSLEAKVCDGETAEKIYSLLEQEPARTKEIVLMRIEGFSFREIGDKHHISENSARVIYFRAKEKIRRILTEEGLLNE